MTSNRFSPDSTPIRLNTSGVYGLPGGPSRDDQIALTPRLEQVRRAMAIRIDSNSDEDKSAIAKIDHQSAALVDLPNRLLSAYRERRRDSPLGRMLTVAKRLRESADRLIVITSRPGRLAIDALLQGCCHPYHNELGRGDRGGRPRLYFHEHPLDNDSTQGLLDLVAHGGAKATVDERFALIVLSPASEIEPGIFFPPLLELFGFDLEQAARLVVYIVKPNEARANSLNGKPIETVERCDSIDDHSAIFSLATLLPAAVVGIDVVRFLMGGVAMNERFLAAPIGDNPVLDLAAAGLATRSRHQQPMRVFAGWQKSLEGIARWHDDIPTDISIAPGDVPCQDIARRSVICPLNTKSLLNWQQSGNRYVQFIMHVSSESARRDRIVLNDETGQTLVELSEQAKQTVELACREIQHPTVDITLPVVDEGSLGQLLQLILLATMVESVCDREGRPGQLPIAEMRDDVR